MAKVAVLCRTYSEFTAALAAQRRALGLTQLEVDARAGFQDQYCGKLEIGTRGVGRMSIETWLQALGLDLLVVARDAAKEPIERRRTHVDPKLGRVLALPKPDASTGSAGHVQHLRQPNGDPSP